MWALAPDATIVAVAIPLLLIATGIAKLLERRLRREDLTPDPHAGKTAEHV
jgi:hypothetical protein